MARVTIAEALNKAHHAVMAADSRVVVIGEDIVGSTEGEGTTELGGAFGVTRGLAGVFGRERVIDTPISEAAFLGMAAGAAMTGLRPIVEVMFCDFLGVCFDQLMNQTAKLRFLSNGRVKLPLVIRTTMGAGDGSGATHSQSLHGLVASLPGLVVACPATASDAAGLLKSAVASDSPVVLLEHKGLYGFESELVDELPPVRLGEGRVVCEGDDVTIVALSAMLHQAQKAAGQLAAGGVQAEVIDPRTVQPLDSQLILASLKKTGRLLVVDEGAAFAGFADAVLALAAQEGFDSLRAAPKALTPLHTPVPYGRAAEAAWLPHAGDIVTAVKTMLTRGPV
ncbi:alpha-ketoacid dehydrogenase subunit beta [Kordiimonas aestuarii]|uniref:alpha-ketoacid dehydrogenase subunit beta n=1 Tax=Kordiimonas aestuarii TaxID=1005925 RepID=UPI0021CEEA4A|nr:transketolase C-terminal domain-containing protein [Kordiimonas aestuarii]